MKYVALTERFIQTFFISITLPAANSNTRLQDIYFDNTNENTTNHQVTPTFTSTQSKSHYYSKSMYIYITPSASDISNQTNI